jgi:hypothetical protein
LFFVFFFRFDVFAFAQLDILGMGPMSKH